MLISLIFLNSSLFQTIWTIEKQQRQEEARADGRARRSIKLRGTWRVFERTFQEEKNLWCFGWLLEMFAAMSNRYKRGWRRCLPCSTFYRIRCRLVICRLCLGSIWSSKFLLGLDSVRQYPGAVPKVPWWGQVGDQSREESKIKTRDQAQDQVERRRR